MPQPPVTLNTFESLLQIIADLRGPEGCPWDKEQTHQSLTPYAIEETHEMVEAIEGGDDEHICEELGDVLFQVVLHAQLASERNAFGIQNVIEGISGKIVRRHPHVFGEVKVENADEVIRNWDEIKKKEKKRPSGKIFDVPQSLPALQRAHEIGKNTEKYRFDWQNIAAVLSQLKSEISELEAALSLPDGEERRHQIVHELGDVLFSAAQLGRHAGVDSETTLREANRRFIRRFEYMVGRGPSLENFVQASPEDKERLWAEAKTAEKNSVS